jgi:hypothetical protein
VKHFNWSETRGKKRIHKKPNARQMAACKPWLEAEIQLLRPTVIVLLGATAAQQLLGPGFSIMKEPRAADPKLAGATCHCNCASLVDSTSAGRRNFRSPQWQRSCKTCET